MKTVLVTCAGSGVGQSVIDSLNITNEFSIIGCDSNPNVYAHSFCNLFFEVPGIYSEGYLEHILDLAIANNVDIIVPGHDHELVLFAAQYEIFKIKNIEVIVSNPEIIAVSRDKQKWYDFFSPLGCKIVPTLSVKEFKANPDSTILPAIVKPSGGSASQGISIINNLNELEGLNEEDIIQPYLFPEETDRNYPKIFNAVKEGKFLQMSEISIQLVFDKKSKFKSIFISKNSLKNGVPVYVDPIDPAQFRNIDEVMKFVPILEAYGARGPVNIQGRITPKGLFFFEMNMRFTGITGNRSLLGFNEVSFLVNNFLNVATELGGYAYNKVGVRQVACTTIPRQYEKRELDTLILLGAGSNVGQCFLTKFASRYKRINVVVRNESWTKYVNLFSKVPNVHLIKDNDPDIDQLFSQSDVLINFVSALAYEDDQRKYEAIRFLQSYIFKIAKSNINKLINISSQSVYPQNEDILKNEDHHVAFSNGYSFQKVIIEDMFDSIRELRPLSNVVSLRLARVLAPNVPAQSGFFGRAIQEYQAGNTVRIADPLSNTNLIHVDDVINALQFVVEQMEERVLPPRLNVGGENLSMADYANLVQDNVQGAGCFELGQDQTVRKSSMVETDRLNKLGWSYKYSVVDIIKEMR